MADLGLESRSPAPLPLDTLSTAFKADYQQIWNCGELSEGDGRRGRLVTLDLAAAGSMMIKYVGFGACRYGFKS